MEMDSSTDRKFSRHLVVRLPGVVWRDNGHGWAFNRRLLRRVHEVCWRSYEEAGRQAGPAPPAWGGCPAANPGIGC